MFAVSRPRKASWQRRGGGVLALVRDRIAATLDTQMSSPDILVLDLGRSWVLGVYILPDSGRWQGWTDVDPELKLWETLALCSASAKPLIVLGDFNARTGSLAASNTHLPRTSFDNVVNRRGRELLSAALDLDLTVLNGTEREHSTPGRFTSFQPNGQAVIDYALVSTEALPRVESLQIMTPHADPDDDWADHVPIVVTVERHLVYMNRRRVRGPTQEVQWPAIENEIDVLWQETIDSAETPEQARSTLYGPVSFSTPELQVYTDGSCFNNGRADAVAGSGVYWGKGSGKNKSLRVPGPYRQTNNRGEIYAVIHALLDADPRRNLQIVTDSELVIREACYWAPQHAQLGWDCPNGDLLKDMVRLLAARMAPTRFVWVKGHSGNEWGDAADSLAKAGALQPWVADYVPLPDVPWDVDVP
ncbi:ribonuclease H-like domain-containing protein, partial [Lyophyllum atratum]